MPARLGRRTDRLARTGGPLEAVTRADPAMIHIDHTVAVQKQRPPVQQAGNLLLRTREILRDANVAEVSLAYRATQFTPCGEMRHDVGLQRTGRPQRINQTMIEQVDARVDHPRRIGYRPLPECTHA